MWQSQRTAHQGWGGAWRLMLHQAIQARLHAPDIVERRMHNSGADWWMLFCSRHVQSCSPPHPDRMCVHVHEIYTTARRQAPCSENARLGDPWHSAQLVRPLEPQMDSRGSTNPAENTAVTYRAERAPAVLLRLRGTACQSMHQCSMLAAHGQSSRRGKLRTPSSAL